MTCPTREELVALLDGLVPGSLAPRGAGPGRGLADGPGPLAAARRHLDACASCRVELARLEAGIAALRAGSPAVEPSPFFAVRLAARLAAEPPPRRRRLLDLLSATRWRLAAAGGLAAALALGLVVVHRARSADELAVAERLELFEELEVVASVGEVETADDVAVIASLGDPGPKEGRP